MSLTVRFPAFLFVYTMKSIRRRARSWRRPTSRLYITADAIFLCDISRNTIKSRFRKLPIRRHSGHSASSSSSIDRSIELCVVSFNIAPHKLSPSSVAFSQGENMRLRSTASTAFSIHCSSYARDIRSNVYFFLVEQDLRQDRHLPFTSPNLQMTPFTAGF
jgi:hypothetical protein